MAGGTEISSNGDCGPIDRSSRLGPVVSLIALASFSERRAGMFTSGISTQDS
jgi:hypothetical protein